MNYKKIGLKCGIEIHRQLDTKNKLFCKCKNSLSNEDPIMSVSRRLRPVAGELGLVDPAAVHEVLKDKEYLYKIYKKETCLVDLDCEPPGPLNPEAMDVTLTICELLKCEVPDEVHVMRKTVIDGSNTTGFQRTAIVGMSGKLVTPGGSVGVTNVSVEEEAAQILGREDGKVIYGLDRIGIPLVEIGTTPDIKSPEHAKEVAAKLGMIVKSTGKAKSGLGTIRQDVNVSIRDGARCEIKGAQDLKLIPKWVENEALRQISLLEIKSELLKKKFKRVHPKTVHVSHVFKGSDSKIVKGKSTFALLVPDFEGYLKKQITPTRTLGNELASYVRAKSDLKGIIHSDEDLDKYKLTKHFDELRKHLKTKKGDTLIIAVGQKEMVEKTMIHIADRINLLVEGVPEETRKPLDNGDSDYLRPLPGSARMYPETDVPPIRVDEKHLRAIRKNLPELLEDKHDRHQKEITKKYKISEEMTRQLIKANKKDLFDKICAAGGDPSIAATTLTSTLRDLERKKVRIDKIKEKEYIEIFEMHATGKIPKEKIPQLLENAAKGAGIEIDDSLSQKDLQEIIEKTIKENPNLKEDPRGEKILLGLVMRIVRGRVNANAVMDELKKALKN